MAIDIRLLNESEYEAANDLFNRSRHIDRSAPIKPRSFAQFRWEFLDCPNGKAIYAGAWELHDEKEPLLIGTQCMILLKMITTDGREILTAKGEGTLIDIRAMMRHKKTDILAQLLGFLEPECKKAGAEFIWGFNNIPASYKRLGYENPFKSHHAICVLKPYKAYKNLSALKTNSFTDRAKIALRSGIAYILSLKKLSIPSFTNEMNREMDENKTLFENATVPDTMVFLLQDMNYLDWRISKNPHALAYRFFQMKDENDTLTAQVICSIRSDVAFIEQTLFHKKVNKNTRLSFLKRIIEVLQSQNICIIRYTGFNNNPLNANEMELLKNLGFIFTGKGDWFTFKNLSGNTTIKPEMLYLSRMYKQGTN